MCGDIEEEDRLEGDLYQRFLVHSRAMLGRPAARGDDMSPPGRPKGEYRSATHEGTLMNAYLDQLFADLLRRCVDDAEAVAAPNAYRQVAMQSVVLARLAGFLAGHAALNEDPLRKVMEAVMLGYGEAEAPLHGHAHDHGHEHGHEHEHERRADVTRA